ncbi:MAG: glycosyltransferase [Pseudomonadota bacterium]
MKIVIDLQAAQSESRLRGIGRYSLSLAKAIAKNPGKHDIWLALNSCFPDTIESIHLSFRGLIPSQQIKVFQTNQPSAEYYSKNINNANISRKLRANFLHNLNADIIHLSSLFEGLIDNSITSIENFNQFYLTSVTLYDLIPLIHSKNYLQDNNTCRYYYKKLQDLKKADLLCAISTSAKQEAIDLLSISPNKIIHCSSGVDEKFKPTRISNQAQFNIKKYCGINRKFILYVGGFDHRKNIQGLIEGFSLLNNNLRKKYQLLIVGNATNSIRQNIFSLAKRFSLNENEVLISGYVTDDQLISLYNLCCLFVFPSFHEGLGLPILEAMACGAATIASNTSGLSEIIGCKDALFDPKYPNKIAEKITFLLNNKMFKNYIIEYGKQRIKKFTWDATARKVLEAYEDALQIKNKKIFFLNKHYYLKNKKIAFVSPFPPDKTGIANYSMQLVTELVYFYDIILIVEKLSESKFNPWLTANFLIKDCDWFKKNASSFDIILYQVGNSHYNYYMFKLIEQYPGIVVLHDFFISDVLHYFSKKNIENHYSFLRSLFFSHGFSALCDYQKIGIIKTINKYPCNFSILKKSTGIIVHSKNALELAYNWYKLNNPIFIKKIQKIKPMFTQIDKVIARNKLNLSDNDFLVCSFGYITPSKLIHRICLSLKNSLKNSNFHLVFVGHSLIKNYENKLFTIIKKYQLNKKITITNFVSSELFSTYLSAANIAIQLRSHSRGETSFSIISCLDSGIPTIINTHAGSNEFPDNTVYKVSENFTNQELENAVEYLYQNQAFRNQLSKNASTYVNKIHHPNKIAKKYYEVIEFFKAYNPNFLEKNLINDLAENFNPQENESILATSANIVFNRIQIGLNQFLIDITTLADIDYKTGIQRVVRGILLILLNNPPEGFRIEPIYINKNGHYLYARKYTLSILGLDQGTLEDDMVEINAGDIFLGLDLCLDTIPRGMPILRNWKLQGVKFYFIIYDFLPLLHPNFFPSCMYNGFLSWLKLISEISHGLICISKQVAKELLNFFRSNTLSLTQVNIGYFYLGSNIDATLPSHEGTIDKKLMDKIFSRKTFLSVSTIEPRKGYLQLINAFSQLWLSNYAINLIIIGKQGWMVEKTIDKILNHSEFGKRLFWLKNASDKELKEIYNRSTALVMASEGEGFGLPIIEAAHCGLNVIARDIPVFREIAGKHAFYFTGMDPKELANALKDWLILYSKKITPNIKGMKYLSWKESTQMLLNVIIQNRWLTTNKAQQTLTLLEDQFYEIEN